MHSSAELAAHCCRMEIITPKDYVGSLMELCQGRRGDFVDMQYLTEHRTTLIYNLPLAEVGHPNVAVCMFPGHGLCFWLVVLQDGKAVFSAQQHIESLLQHPSWKVVLTA